MKRNEKGKKIFWLIISEILHSTFLSAFDMKKGRPPLSRTKSRPKKNCHWWEKSKCFFLPQTDVSQKKVPELTQDDSKRNWNPAMVIVHCSGVKSNAKVFLRNQRIHFGVMVEWLKQSLADQDIRDSIPVCVFLSWCGRGQTDCFLIKNV